MEGQNLRGLHSPEPHPAGNPRTEPVLDGLLERVAQGDQRAFEAVFDTMAGPVYGLIHQVLRDTAQSEEVSQEVMLEVWRTAVRFDRSRGTAASWVMTIAHRRAIDRVRSASAAVAREHQAATRQALEDQVGDSVDARLARERVRRCLQGLTELQRESIILAYYGGYSYRQVAGMLGVALSTIKTRIRAGLIRMRDCLGVRW